jgi:ARS binding protein 2
MSPPPLFDRLSRGAQHTIDPHAIDNPALPSRNFSDNDFDDAFVKFILYANPGVPRDVDTTELRRVFRAPPRSDGKSFSIYTLWQLIKKLENKELKTWSQLAIELGVEPPSTEKGQSTQKIQQYAVRLKRWMRAMHIDAFFEFCLGKPHRYYTELPTAAANSSEEGRDGVPLEEDLALRALMPEWRPKRGRKKNEEKESETALDQPAPKRPHIESHHSSIEYDGLGVHSAIFPGSAQPWTAYPDDVNHDGWNNMPSALPPGQNMPPNVNPNLFPGRAGFEFPRWRRDMSPSNYPQSAVTLGHRHPEIVTNEPQSAITPSSSSKTKSSRRRHGPAVSSAWPRKGNAGQGKQRGRPPAPKATQDEPQSGELSNEQPTGVPPMLHEIQHQSQVVPHPARSQAPPTQHPPQSRPNKLQLQVPQRLGGPVRLATPPLVLVNGAGHLRRSSADYFRNPEGDDEDGESIVVEQQRPSDRIHDSDFTAEDVARAFATRLLRIKIIGRPVGLSVEEANMVASKAVLSICGDTIGGGPKSSRILAMKCAIILGVEREMGVSSISNINNDSHLSVRSVFQSADGSISRSRKPNGSTTANDTKGSYNYTISIDTTNLSSTFSSNVQIRDLVVPAQIPSNNMDDDFSSIREQIKSLSEVPASAIEPPTAIHGDEDAMDDAWRQRFRDVRRDEKVAEEKLRRLKRLMLEVVMGSE